MRYEPMLLTPVNKNLPVIDQLPPSRSGWSYEVKWDGWRMMTEATIRI